VEVTKQDVRLGAAGDWSKSVYKSGSEWDKILEAQVSCVSNLAEM